MRTRIIVGLAGLGFGFPALADITVYSQPATPVDANVGLGFYSQSEPRVRKNYKHADDFTLTQDASIGGVVWWGQSSRHTHADLRNFDTFLIEFMAVRDVNGQALPGDVLASYEFAIGDTAPFATGRVTPGGALEHRHEVTLPSAFEADAGTRYFVAISAGMILTNSPSDAWQWQDAETVNGWSGVYTWPTGLWSGFQDTDSAFELIAVPAPAAALPMGGCLWAFLRRTRVL